MDAKLNRRNEKQLKGYYKRLLCSLTLLYRKAVSR